MKEQPSKGSRLQEFVPRVTAMAFVIACHLAALLLLPLSRFELRDVSRGAADLHPLKLRFIEPLEPPKAVATHHEVKRPAPVPPTRRIAHAAETPPRSAAISQPPSDEVRPKNAPLVGFGLSSYATPGTTSSDGNFSERLRQAQHATDVRGVPGSDRRIVPGITLTDPMHQGVGAVLRNVQRLFGVTNRHCIDVDVWQHLSPEERIARHVSLKEIEKINSQFDCQRPMGLSF